MKEMYMQCRERSIRWMKKTETPAACIAWDLALGCWRLKAGAECKSVLQV